DPLPPATQSVIECRSTYSQPARRLRMISPAAIAHHLIDCQLLPPEMLVERFASEHHGVIFDVTRHDHLLKTCLTSHLCRSDDLAVTGLCCQSFEHRLQFPHIARPPVAAKELNGLFFHIRPKPELQAPSDGVEKVFYEKGDIRRMVPERRRP